MQPTETGRFRETPLPGMPGRTAVLFLVSDGGGSTVEGAVDAAMAQFPNVEFQVIRRPGVRAREQLLHVVREAAEVDGLIVHTIVIQSLRHLLIRECRARLLPQIDLIGPLLGHISQRVGRKPIHVPGASRGIDVDYFRRIDAIQYTVQHDDGQGVTTLDEADVVLVGVSRSSKTPLSIYLSMRGWKVANIPIVLGVQPPPQLQEIEQRRIVAVTIDQPHLMQIRRNRMQALGGRLDGEYTDHDQMLEELKYFRRIVRSGYPWPIVNITGKSVEEAAKEVIVIIESQRVPTNALLDETAPSLVAEDEQPR